MIKLLQQMFLRKQGKVQAMDRKFDLALVKVDVPRGHVLPVAEIGRSVGLRAGEFVVAMGSPRGLSKSCTLGIVSATARRRSELGERGGERDKRTERPEVLYFCSIFCGGAEFPRCGTEGCELTRGV